MTTLPDAATNTSQSLLYHLSFLQRSEMSTASAAGAATIVYLAYKVVDVFVLAPNRSPLKVLPGPERVDSYCE